jgi:phage/plasmid-associated DNA primase
VYDHKFTGNTGYVSDEPKDKDKRQVNMYIYGLDGVDTGQLEYVQRDGTFHPTDSSVSVHTFDFDQELFDDTVENMKAVAEEVKLAEKTGTEYQNPFKKCDCYFCEKETLKPEVKEELDRDSPDGNIYD